MRLSKDSSGILIDSSSAKLFSKTYYVITALVYRDSVNNLLLNNCEQENEAVRYAFAQKDTAYVKQAQETDKYKKISEKQTVTIKRYALVTKILVSACILQFGILLL